MTAIDLFAVGNTKAQEAKYITEQHRHICLLGIQSKNRLGRAAKPEDSPHYESLLKDARLYLQKLGTIKMTCEVDERYGMTKMLEFILDDPRFCFPPDMVACAKDLRARWEKEEEVNNTIEDGDGMSSILRDEDMDSTLGNEEMESVIEDEDIDLRIEEAEDLASRTTLEDSVEEAHEGLIFRSSPLPCDLPSDHPVFDKNGIMHGVTISRTSTGRRTYKLDRSIPHKSPKVFGHNGIAVGTWFANQLVALQRGAHGSRMGGIAGSAGDGGAYSIVVSSNYEDLDIDKGDTLYYSGPNSHNNTDPKNPAVSTAGTKALKASMHTKNLVRVLRSGRAQGSLRANSWLPECGLRYDGLYRVDGMRLPLNKKGGRFEQFVLRREPDQTPLTELRRNSPTTQQKFDLAAIQRGF